MYFSGLFSYNQGAKMINMCINLTKGKAFLMNDCVSYWHLGVVISHILITVGQIADL